MEQRPNGEKGKIRWGRREIGENSIIIIIITTIKKITFKFKIFACDFKKDTNSRLEIKKNDNQ